MKIAYNILHSKSITFTKYTHTGTLNILATITSNPIKRLRVREKTSKQKRIRKKSEGNWCIILFLYVSLQLLKSEIDLMTFLVFIDDKNRNEQNKRIWQLMKIQMWRRMTVCEREKVKWIVFWNSYFSWEIEQCVFIAHIHKIFKTKFALRIVLSSFVCMCTDVGSWCVCVFIFSNSDLVSQTRATNSPPENISTHTIKWQLWQHKWIKYNAQCAFHFEYCVYMCNEMTSHEQHELQNTIHLTLPLSSSHSFHIWIFFNCQKDWCYANVMQWNAGCSRFLF